MSDPDNPYQSPEADARPKASRPKPGRLKRLLTADRLRKGLLVLFLFLMAAWLLGLAILFWRGP